MLCQNCKQKPATVFAEQNINGSVTQAHLCENCARSALFSGTPSLLAEMLGWDTHRITTGEDVCPECGMKLQELHSSARAGCGNCYTFFAPVLKPFISRIHRAGKHTGKVPRSAGAEISRKRTLAALEEQLRGCVEKQEFERAAELRDEINKLKGGAA